MFLLCSPFRFHWPLEAFRWAPDCSRELQNGAKRASRRAQQRAKSPQERPKRVPRSDSSGPDGGTEIKARLFFARRQQGICTWCHLGALLGPSWHHEGPRELKMTPSWPKDGPRWSQEAPRWPQEAPRWPQNGPVFVLYSLSCLS